MRLSFGRVLRLSRPRFWVYLFGPYLIGILAALNGSDDFGQILRSPRALAFALFFLFPANLLVYGVNDIFDYETDKRNPKKQGYETLLVPEQQSQAWIWIIACASPFFLAAMRLPAIATVGIVLFALLSIFYSVPPIRAKARPFVDMAFNTLYAMPALVGYGIGGGTHWPAMPLLAAAFWCFAMHAYSAVPDIAADREAKIATTATVLEKQKTILLCSVFYAASALIAAFATPIGPLALVLGTGYLVLMAASWRAPDDAALHRVYAIFPVFNTLSGMALTILLLARMH
jgi:4-hydroxybenzoate polyprenyltransferase